MWCLMMVAFQPMFIQELIKDTIQLIYYSILHTLINLPQSIFKVRGFFPLALFFIIQYPCCKLYCSTFYHSYTFVLTQNLNEISQISESVQSAQNAATTPENYVLTYIPMMLIIE